MKFRTVLAWSVGLLIAAAPGWAGGEDSYCPNAQSPRNVDPGARPSPYQLRGQTSIVGRVAADSIEYLPRVGGPPQTLYRCGQHYHFPIETPQGCGGKAAAGGHSAAGEAGAAHADPPPPRSWVEIHTVYAANQVAPANCDPETLACCIDPPFLVRAFGAKVTAGGRPEPIVPPAGRPLAEWSGSTTGAGSEACKPAALWSFHLGCRFTVSEAQLKEFNHRDPARPEQTGDKLSRDLTLVGP
jgi:hypothetical protein